MTASKKRLKRKRTFVQGADASKSASAAKNVSGTNADAQSSSGSLPRVKSANQNSAKNALGSSTSKLPKVESASSGVFKSSKALVSAATVGKSLRLLRHASMKSKKWDNLQPSGESRSKLVVGNRSVRELVRREGMLHGGGNRIHRKKASGVCQIVQRGGTYFVRLRQVATSNQHNSGLHVYITTFPTSAEMSKVERKGVALDVPNSEDQLYHNEFEGAAPIDLPLPTVTDVDPLDWSGLALVKNKASWPTTDHPVVYAYCNFSAVNQDFSKLESVIQSRRENIKKFQGTKGDAVWGTGRTFADIRREVKPMLKYFDKDKSGSIDLVEFRDVLENLGVKVTEARAIKLFQTCDVDNSKAMDIEELPAALYLNSLLKPCATSTPKDIFDMLDSEKSGGLDEVEFFEGLRVLGIDDLSSKESERLFRQVDQDRSGFISYPEFLAAWVNLCDLNAEMKRRGLVITSVQDEMLQERQNKVKSHRETIAKALAKQQGKAQTRLSQREVDISGLDSIENQPIQSLIELNTKKIGLMETVFGVGRRKRKKAILMQYVLKHDIQATREFDAAHKKTKEEASQLRQKRDNKKREIKNLRAKEALAARKEKSRADRQARKKKAHEVQESRNLQKREAELREKMNLEISERKERQRIAQKEAREWQKRMEKDARARRGEDRMNLTNGNIRHIPLNVYKGKEAQEILSHLVVLNLSGNKLESLPHTGFLFWCSSLRKLDLSKNRITGPLPSEFEALEHLQVLNLYSNKLEHLPPSIRGLKSLKILNVAENNLVCLPDEIGEVKKLHTLIAYHNMLTVVPRSIKHLTALTKLDLALNQLTELPEEVAGLEKLTSLNVSWNQMRRFPRAIGKLHSLEELEMSSNRMRRLPDTLDGLKSLTVFSIRSNELIEIPSSIRGLSSLLHFDASYNRVQKIPLSIGSLTTLQSLDLSHNEIKDVPAQFGYLKDLLNLDFHDNMLSTIPPEIGALASLQRLNFSHNRIQGRIPKQFGALFCLVDCILSFNEIEALPSSISGMLGLRTLDLQHNRVVAIPGEIQFMKALQVLLLNNNRLKELPPTLSLVKPLVTLDLSSNQIVKLYDNMHQMSSLRHLKLHHNRLTCIPPSFGKLIPNLETFVVTHNPFSELPSKWCENWEVRDQAELLWSNGYSSAQVANWAMETVEYFQDAAAEFEASPLKYAKREPGYSLEKYVQRVKERMGNRYHPRFHRDITQFFFKARKLGSVPRYYKCDEEETSTVKELQENHAKFRNDMAVFARERQEAEDLRMSKYYHFSKSYLRQVDLRLDDRRRSIHKRKVKAEIDQLTVETQRCMEEQEAIARARDVLRREKIKMERKEWMNLFHKARSDHVRKYKADRKTRHLGAPTGTLLREIKEIDSAVYGDSIQSSASVSRSSAAATLLESSQFASECTSSNYDGESSFEVVHQDESKETEVKQEIDSIEAEG